MEAEGAPGPSRSLRRKDILPLRGEGVPGVQEDPGRASVISHISASGSQRAVLRWRQAHGVQGPLLGSRRAGPGAFPSGSTRCVLQAAVPSTLKLAQDLTLVLSSCSRGLWFSLRGSDSWPQPAGRTWWPVRQDASQAGAQVAEPMPRVTLRRRRLGLGEASCFPAHVGWPRLCQAGPQQPPPPRSSLQAGGRDRPRKG